MIKKTGLALIFCTLLSFTQPTLTGRTTTVVTTVHESPSFLELLWKTDTELAVYVTTGVIVGGIVGFIACLISKAERREHRYSRY